MRETYFCRSAVSFDFFISYELREIEREKKGASGRRFLRIFKFPLFINIEFKIILSHMMNRIKILLHIFFACHGTYNFIPYVYFAFPKNSKSTDLVFILKLCAEYIYSFSLSLFFFRVKYRHIWPIFFGRRLIDVSSIEARRIFSFNDNENDNDFMTVKWKNFFVFFSMKENCRLKYFEETIHNIRIIKDNCQIDWKRQLTINFIVCGAESIKCCQCRILQD